MAQQKGDGNQEAKYSALLATKRNYGARTAAIAFPTFGHIKAVVFLSANYAVWTF
jgi:hypothetical protein